MASSYPAICCPHAPQPPPTSSRSLAPPLLVLSSPSETSLEMFFNSYVTPGMYVIFSKLNSPI